MEKLTTSLIISLTNMTLAGSMIDRRGIAVMICSVLKTFQSYDMTPLRTKFKANVIAKPAWSALLATSAEAYKVTKSP